MTPPAPGPRLDAITGLRWWAAFAVFFFHIRSLVPLPGPLDALAPFGNFGVTFFFVLSGFVLTWSWREETDKRTFYWRRFARIYPLSLVTLLLALPVFYSFTPDPAEPWVKPVDWGILLLCLLLLQGWWRDPAILFAGNPAAWTLTIEAFFYALHPFVTLALRRLSLIGALFAAGGIAALAIGTRAAIVAAPSSTLAALPWPVLRLSEFLLGMCVAWAFRRGWLPRIPLAAPLLLLAGWFGALLALRPGEPLGDGFTIVRPYTSEVVTILCALLIASVASLELRGRARMLRARPVVALGEWSFAFYLVHATLIYLALDLFGRQSGGWHAVFWSAGLLAASLAAAWVLHVGVERPVEKRLRAWQPRRRALTA